MKKKSSKNLVDNFMDSSKLARSEMSTLSPPLPQLDRHMSKKTTGSITADAPIIGALGQMYND